MSYYTCSLCLEHIPTDNHTNRLNQHTLWHMTRFFKDGTKAWNVTGNAVYTLVVDKHTKFEYEEPWEKI